MGAEHTVVQHNVNLHVCTVRLLLLERRLVVPIPRAPAVLEGGLEGIVVLGHDVEYAVRHRLLVVGAHLCHEAKVEQRHPTVGHRK